jgi:starch-binding outer membrane protein, SusD/RagB family
MIRNKIYATLLLQIVLMILLACSDNFLDRKPIDTLVTGNFYATPEGIQAAVNAIYAPLGEEGFNGKTIWMIGDGASDDAQANGVDPDYIPIDQFTLASDNARNADLWQVIYRVIALTNIVLENIDGNSAEQSLLDRIEGEALTVRGYAYFTLVRLYSDVPLILDGMSAAELAAPVRSSAYEVFQHIISDFEQGAALLPARSGYTGDDIARVNRHTAMGMLAKVYITIAGDLSMYNTESHPDNETSIRSIADPATCYQKALDLCNTIIGSGEFSLMPNFGDLFDRINGELPGDNCAESIWQLQFIGCGQRHGSGNMMQAFWAPWQSQITGAGDGWGTHSPHSDLARCFYDDPDSLVVTGNLVDSLVVPPGDKRFRETLMFPGVEYPELPVGEESTPYTLAYSYGASGFACKKYIIGSGSDVCSMSAPNNSYLLRLADIYLLKAECLVELNRPAEAAPVLDPIRRRAGKAGISNTLSQSEMRDAVRLERRRELALEQQRWFDILRWGIAYDVLANQGITLEPDRRLFPIPGTEIALNKNLVQNTSY